MRLWKSFTNSEQIYGCYTSRHEIPRLAENLQKILWQRIDARELSGLRLAQQARFQQAHISNFLNPKRGLSLDGMDKIVSAQRLSIFDLLDTAEINRRASIPPPSDDEFQNVLLTDASIAAAQS